MADIHYQILPKLSCHYTPTPRKSLKLRSCIEPESMRRYGELVKKINSLSVPRADRGALLLLAARHLEFNFSLIADVYAAAAPEVQAMLEALGAVFVDEDDRIEELLDKLYDRTGMDLREPEQRPQLELELGID